MVAMGKADEIFEKLKAAVLEYNSEEAERLAKKAVAEGIDPTKTLAILTGAIRQVGDSFERGELFLPELVGAANAMDCATRILSEEMESKKIEPESQGTMIIGTVFGDIHSLGKTMVATLTRAEGFKVIDLGVDVKAEKFIEAVKLNKPNILAMSALMTTTAPEQKKVIAMLGEEGLRDKVKIIVGGGSITQEFADSISADGYDPTAPGAAKLAKKLVAA